VIAQVPPIQPPLPEPFWSALLALVSAGVGWLVRHFGGNKGSGGR
jgi:hypothetical protein